MFVKLSKSTIFKSLSEDDIKFLLNQVNYYVKSFKDEEFIAFRGDKVDAYMILLEGELVSEMQKLNGKVVKIENLLPYADIAPAFVFGADNSFPIDLYAIKDSKILFIPRQELLKLLQINSKLLENILNSFSNRTQFLSKKLWFSNKTIEEKLATYILENLDKNNLWHIKKTITDLANIFGVSRPSLSRVITALIDENILERVSNSSFKLIDKNSLLEKF
jgi:CRP-like cAMP-binding protein